MKDEIPFKPLDFVTPISDENCIGIITEISSYEGQNNTTIYQASVTWLKPYNLKNAWWVQGELAVINNLAKILSEGLAHPFGKGKQFVNKCY